MDSNQKSLFLSILGLLVFLPNFAFAHTGVGNTTGLASGFSHPIGGLDHLLAMIAVGIWAALMGDKATWVVPSVFVLLMLLGGILGVSGIKVPFTEIGVLASVIILGLFISAKIKTPVFISSLVVGLFAIFHGHAHGTEMPLASEPISYCFGFTMVTILLHIVGIAIGLSFNKWASEKSFRLAGASVTLFGIYLLVS